MVATLAEKDIVYSVKGGFSGVRVPDIAGDFGLGDGNVSFELTQSGISMDGQGRFGPAPVTFEWRELVGGGDGQAELIARARATPDLFNAFGLAARNFMQGEADLELRASGPGGRNFDTVTATVDLEHAQLELAELGWRKPFEEPAKGSFRYGKDAEGAVLVGDIRADGIDVAGIAHVVNYDLPHAPEDYVHRVGCTARAAASGQASSFAAPEEKELLVTIEALLRAPVPRQSVPREEMVFQEAIADERARQADPGPPQANAGQSTRPPGQPMGRHARTHRKKPPA
jgi:hypothetical protein